MERQGLAPFDLIKGLEALGRLLEVAQRDTGQSRRVASFPLAWHNAEENGGWNPVDLWQLDVPMSCWCCSFSLENTTTLMT